jgi:hypothetical protein
MSRAGTLQLTAAAVVLALGANVAIGVALAGERTAPAGALVALLPAILVLAGALVATHRHVLVFAALALNLSGLSIFARPLPLPAGPQVFPADALLLLAVGAALVARLTPRTAADPGVVRPRLRTPVLGLPLLLLVVGLTFGIIKGHERYGSPLIGQPTRLFLFAAIAVAITDLEPARAWRGITAVFYAGAVVQSLFAVYYMASGTSQTGSLSLSTGGIRILALSTSIYLTGSLLCAMLNLELNRNRAGRQMLDAVIGLLALFGIVVSFGRTTYVAVAAIVPILFVARRQLRRSVIQILPLFAPALVVVVLMIPIASPDLISTLDARLTKTSSTDLNVVWRDRARAAVMKGVNDEIVTGVGFGRHSSFLLNGQRVDIEGDPHNSYIYLLAGGGALALGTLLLLAAAYLFDGWRRIRASAGVSQALVVWSVGTWLAFMINALAGPILTDTTMLMTIWITMLLPAIVSADRGTLGRAA